MRYEVSPKYRRAPFASVTEDFVEEGSATPTPRFWSDWPEPVADDSPEALRRADKMLAQVRANQAARDATKAAQDYIVGTHVDDHPTDKRGRKPGKHMLKGSPEAKRVMAEVRAARSARSVLPDQLATDLGDLPPPTPHFKNPAPHQVKGSPEAKAFMAEVAAKQRAKQHPTPQPVSTATLRKLDEVEEKLALEGHPVEAVRKSIAQWWASRS